MGAGPPSTGESLIGFLPIIFIIIIGVSSLLIWQKRDYKIRLQIIERKKREEKRKQAREAKAKQAEEEKRKRAQQEQEREKRVIQEAEAKLRAAEERERKRREEERRERKRQQERSEAEERQWKSLYEILGVSINATDEEIIKAWRNELLKYHPDRLQHFGVEFQEMAEKRTKEINEAKDKIMAIKRQKSL